MNSNNIWKWWWWWNLYRDKTPNGTLNDYCGSAIAESLIRGKHIYSFLRETKFSHVYYLNLLFRASNWCCRCIIFWWRTSDLTFKLLLVFILLQREAREKILSILTDPLFYFIVRFYFSDVLCFPSNEGKVKLSNIKHTSWITVVIFSRKILLP